MNVFNPKILDASIRDVASCLSDNQKADLLLYAMNSLQFEGRSRTVIENAIQSCLQIATLSSENTAKARILRARARLHTGSHFGAQEDLQAALVAEPDNPEAKALLHQRSVTVEKLLAPLPPNRGRFSIEIWREIALFLPRHDLKALLWVPHPISRLASQLLFRQLDLHFCETYDPDDDANDPWNPNASPSMLKDHDTRHAQRSADILTRIIIDPVFASAVKTLRIYASRRDKDGSMAFQTGMLTNALPKLVNLRNVHISACSEGVAPVLRILQSSNTRLRGLSIDSPDGPADLSVLDFRHLAHFSYTTSNSNSPSSPSTTANPNSNTLPPTLTPFLSQNRCTLRTLTLHNPTWLFPTHALSIRNLTHITFSGHFPANSQVFADLLANGRQLESVTLSCALECVASAQFRSACLSGGGGGSPTVMPFLRHFSFTVHALGRRVQDKDLFPALADFLRDRTSLRTLRLVAHSSSSSTTTTTLPGGLGTSEEDDEGMQRAVGFDASIWGVLPSLVELRGLTMTYPRDLAPGLASWLVPRGVRALTVECGGLGGREMSGFLNQLRLGMPPGLRYIGLVDSPLRSVSTILEAGGFPMVRVIRVGPNFWTVKRNESVASSSSSAGPSGGGSAASSLVRLEQWPRRRIMFHMREWLEWLGCEDALAGVPAEFPVY